MKLFVMSDIHSYYSEMREALKEKQFDFSNPDHHVVICGDLFDRGPDAVEVFDFVRSLAAMKRLHYIYGNHEELLHQAVQKLEKGYSLEYYYQTNGTLDTLVQLTGIPAADLMLGCYDHKRFATAIKSVFDFISAEAKNYIEIGNYVFVHGWIPFVPGTHEISDNWRDGDWELAWWANGMLEWDLGARLLDRTIVCGHWHCSWGWSHLKHDGKEFPQKSKENWRDSFRPFVDKGIIALDACTAYSGFCNCIVLDV